MNVTLPDGTPLELPDGATGADAAAAIGPGLAKAALAVVQDGEVRDLGAALAEAFSAPFQDVQWVVVAYLATLTISVVMVGRLGDRHGLRSMHLAGLALFTVASLLCALAPSLWLLVGAKTVAGGWRGNLFVSPCIAQAN